MLTLKDKVLRQINKCDKARRNLQHYIDLVNNKLAWLKEMADDIRIEPRRLGNPKPATTTDDIAKMIDINYGMPTGYTELSNKLEAENILLRDLLKNEYKRITTEVKEQQNNKKDYTVKSKEGSTIMEVETIKLNDKETSNCELCGKPTNNFSLNMCEECFDEETDKHYDGGRDNDE